MLLHYTEAEGGGRRHDRSPLFHCFSVILRDLALWESDHSRLTAPRVCSADRIPIFVSIRRMNILAYPCLAYFPAPQSAIRRRGKASARGSASPSRRT